MVGTDDGKAVAERAGRGVNHLAIAMCGYIVHTYQCKDSTAVHR